MDGHQPLTARHWLALAVALLVLNAVVTFHNVWPTLWVAPRAELSIELGVLLVLIVAWRSLVGPLGRRARIALTSLMLALLLGRYAEVTAPALYGRPVNLYWDAEHLPKVGAMLAEVAPGWLLVLLVLGVVALLVAVVAAIAWCFRTIAYSVEAPSGRLALGALAGGIVAVYVLSQALAWPSRFHYSVPVSATYLQQLRFIYSAYASDPGQNLPIVPLEPADLGNLKGEDVLLMFLESYGAVSYDTPAIARLIAPARDELAHAAAATGRQVVSAFVSAPTFGGGSWLSHASFMSGVEVRDPGHYMLLLTQQRDTWPKLFKAAGYRAVALMPGMKNAWPEGAFYGFDTIYDEQALDYRGPDFGWWRIPDQFSLASAAALARSKESHGPLLMFLPTINTHIPFLPVPPYQADWERVLAPEPFPEPDIEASLARTPDWEALGDPYADSFVYTFTYLAGYLRERPAADEMLLLIGDHQPAASVAGPGARWEVPVHVVTHRADIATALRAAGFIDGVALAPHQRPIATMTELSALLLRTFAAPPAP